MRTAELNADIGAAINEAHRWRNRARAADAGGLRAPAGQYRKRAQAAWEEVVQLMEARDARRVRAANDARMAFGGRP